MDKLYGIWLHKISIPEYIKIKMLNYFGSYQSIYKAADKEYNHFGLKEGQIDRMRQSKANVEPLLKELQSCKEQQIHVVDILEDRYPYYLKQIADPPIILFVKGDLSCLDKPALAIVGSRKCSEYGFEVTYKLSSELAQLGLIIISGLACGIDEAAHKGALKTGNTMAVMGTGINVCYPNQNYQVYKQISERGCLISEYFLGTPPLPHQFPKRNRIISGMAVGVVVAEADIKSGSLITAELALEHNREIFAVPGNINSKMSLGTNELIKNGAKCITKVEDIIEELPYTIRTKLNFSKSNLFENNCYELAQDESMVYAYVSQQPIHFDELFKNTKLPHEVIHPSLIRLEIKGLIKRLPGERYVRV